jgi:hypothetical protein
LPRGSWFKARCTIWIGFDESAFARSDSLKTLRLSWSFARGSLVENRSQNKQPKALKGSALRRPGAVADREQDFDA